MTDVLTLITQSVTTNNYGIEEVTETTNTIFCEVESIQQSEFFAAANTELNPEYKFVVFFGDYNGESVLTYNSVRYSIYRTYRTGDNLELYVERKIGA